MTLLSTLETRLDLEEAPENPYKYRKYARFYDIKKWRENAAFASAVKLALEKGFLSQPVFVNGHITQGGSIQDLEANNDLEAFMKRLADNGFPYDGAHMYLEGPRAAALGINLNLTKKTLEIRSSLDRQRFTQVTDVFENAIDLKLTKDASSEVEVDERTSSGLDLLTKLVLPIFLALLSVEFIKAALPKDNLEITFPRAHADEVTVLAVDMVRPHWIVRRTLWWDTKDLANPPSATLQVLDSEGRVVINMKGVNPGRQMILKPGVYQLSVAIPELGKSDRMRFKITQMKSLAKSH